jgi:dihydrodipicolinate reductase
VGAPSGTARELAFHLSSVRKPEPTVPLGKTVGPRETRSATVSGSQVHSILLPGHVIGAEIIFGMPDQRLTIPHDSGDSARPNTGGVCSPFGRSQRSLASIAVWIQYSISDAGVELQEWLR